MHTFPRALLLDAIVEADMDRSQIIDEYPGRGMYGTTCLAVKLTDAGTPTAQLAHLLFMLGVVCQRETCDGCDGGCAVCEIGPTPVELGGQLASRAKLDELGYDAIVYFPPFTLV